MSKRYFIAGLLVVALVAVIVPKIKYKAPVPDSSGKIQVVTSFYPLYFLASEIGGDKAHVVNITPAGAEPHDYEPTAQDMVQIENANLLILNGAHLEAWGDSIQKNINSVRTTVVTAGEGLAIQNDPHIWLSPILASRMADTIARAFENADSLNATYYESNAQVLKTKLAELDKEYADCLASCGQKNIVTSHSAFSYLAAAYHFNQISIAGLSPNAEPSPKQLADIAKFARDNGVRYIFFESLVSPRLSQTIAKEIGAQTLVLNPLEGLSDADMAAGKTYMTEMRNNLANLKIALTCTP